MASFGERFSVSTMSRDDHQVHLEGVPPSSWKTKPFKRAIDKGEGRSLSFQGLTFFPTDAYAHLFHLGGSVGEFSKLLFFLLANREPPYKEALDWLHFAFTGNPKGQYVAPANNAFAFASPVEGGPLFLPALERLQTLYPGAYARGTTSTSEGAERLED